MSLLLIGLFAYAAVLAVFGPRLLRRFDHHQCEAPRLALALWTTLTASWVVSVISLGLAATAQLSSGGMGLAGILHACLNALLTVVGVRDPGDAPAALALFCALAFLARLLRVAHLHTHRTRQQRQSHKREIRDHAATFVYGGRRLTVVRTQEFAAYCLPGHRPEIVITSATLRQLSPEELGSVIAHERAHLHGRHHLILGWATAAARAFPFAPLLSSAPAEVARLLEWIADDHACRQHEQRTVARALALMATGTRSPDRQPAGALRATGMGVLERVTRLLRQRRTTPPARWRIAAALAVPVLALAIATTVLVPAVTIDPTPLCAGAIPVPAPH